MEYRWVYVIVLALILVVCISFIHQQDRDACVCGSSDDTNTCCSRVHANDITLACIGQWEYNLEKKECRFTCVSSEQTCTTDVFQCPNGKFVSRDPTDKCQFEPCPAP